MEKFMKIEFNKIYIVEDIYPIGLKKNTNLNKFNYILDYDFNEKNKINYFLLKILHDNTNVYEFPTQCFKIFELISYLKMIFKERTNDKIFPFYFYIRKTKNNEIIFIPLDKKVRQLLLGLYGHIYRKVSITKGFLYGFICNSKNLEIYKTNIPSEHFLPILENIDKNINYSLNYNCMVCKREMSKSTLKVCKKCNWAIYCSNRCYNDEKFKNHISDILFTEKENFYEKNNKMQIVKT